MNATDIPATEDPEPHLASRAAWTARSLATLRMSPARGRHPARGERAREIMRRYDLHRISHLEVQAMGRALYDAGCIGAAEMMELTAPYFLAAEAAAPGHAPRIDYLAALRLTLDFLHRHQADDQLAIAYVERLHARFALLASLHA